MLALFCTSEMLSLIFSVLSISHALEVKVFLIFADMMTEENSIFYICIFLTTR